MEVTQSYQQKLQMPYSWPIKVIQDSVHTRHHLLREAKTHKCHVYAGGIVIASGEEADPLHFGDTWNLQHLGATSQVSDGSLFPLEQFQCSAGQTVAQRDRE